ncbi:MAG TPA: putative ABC transporter permease [Candidatus Lachnoclostridium stercorigallinarum]|uniref:ABC transporter permease n=1 Tax=Candidatus Lachnoclostridium stercorigallinarum TaxID=2838634 RepID=A0A9D2GJ91_9FIRM|nr:putative ABC transporter permease [Candidatus Lachnoclostridium stercorigallinarum]
MFYQIVWLFFCYSFLGWVMEAVAATARSRHFVNRGLLDGPLCAIYGFAGVTVTIFLPELRGNWLFLFLGCAIWCTVFEWVAGHILEKSGYGRWWDYSRMPVNLDGYICLPYSILWGVLGSIAVQWGSPLLLSVFSLFPGTAGKVILWILIVLTAIDGIGSLIALFGYQGIMPPLERVDSQITVATRKLQEVISRSTRRRLERTMGMTRVGREKKAKAKVFAQGVGFYKIFWLFFIGSFLGDVTETVFCYITAGTWMSRSSVVWGPFSLVWGIALAAATALLYKYRDRSDGFLFFMGTFLGGAYEYLCSVATERVFGTVFWDYSAIPFNLGGRINLLYCFFWGIAAVVWMKGLYPVFSRWIERIPMKAGTWLTWILAVFMVGNMAVSGLALIRYDQRCQGVEAESSWQAYMDEHYGDDVIQRVYPNAIRV